MLNGAATRERTLKIVEEIRSGRVSVQPSDSDKCRWCDAKDVCRIEVGEAAVQVPSQVAVLEEGA